MTDSITFKRSTAPDYLYLSRAESAEWEVAVRAAAAYRNEPRAIVISRTFSGINYVTLDITEAQARALAHELLHAADVAEAVTQGEQQ